MKRVLIVAGDAVEALEVFYPLFRMREEGFEVHVAAPSKKTLHTVIHDFEPGYETYTEKPGYRLEADLAFADVNPVRYDGLIIPGGRAPEWIRNDPTFDVIALHFFETEKPVAAICHAVLALISAGVCEGRTMTCYPQLACDARAAGATFEDEEVVVDGHLVSSRAWPDNGAWMREFLTLLRK